MELDSVIKKVEETIGNLGREPYDGLFFRGNDYVDSVAFAVDPTVSTIKAAIEKGADLIITHHWINSKKIAKIGSPVLNKALKELARADMSIACYHTVWDFSRNEGNFLHLANLLGLENIYWITKYKDVEGVTVVGELPQEQDFESFRDYLMDKLNPPEFKSYEHNESKFKKIAVSTGGGVKRFLLDDIFKEDIAVYVTGEPEHTGVLYAKDLGISLVCLGHYWTEMIGMKHLMEKVKENSGDAHCFFIDNKGGC